MMESPATEGAWLEITSLRRVICRSCFPTPHMIQMSPTTLICNTHLPTAAGARAVGMQVQGSKHKRQQRGTHKSKGGWGGDRKARVGGEHRVA